MVSGIVSSVVSSVGPVWCLYDSCVKGIVSPPDGSDGVVALFLEDDPDTRDVGDSVLGRGAHETWLRIVGDL